jgi:putative transposase
VQYDPQKHHRRTIRLQGYDYSAPGAYFITICTHQRECLFGEIVDGEMRSNELGQMVNACWQRLPFHFPNLTLDAFVVMPNHVHGILILTNPCRGAALGHNAWHPTENLCPNATPIPKQSPPEPGVIFGQEQSLSEPGEQSPSEPGVAFGQRQLHLTKDGLPNAAPLPPRLVAGSVGSIVLNFKSVTTRSKNRIRRSPGVPLWQRNYYEHIIRGEKSLQYIRQYITNNPIAWQQDQLHPDNPSKW